MRLFTSFLVALTALFVASTAGATVTVNHTQTVGASTINVGDQISVAVRLQWDGQGALQGVFSSTTFDSSVLQVVSIANAPSSILGFVDPDTADIIPGLSRLGGFSQPGDPSNVIRTVQYGGTSSPDPRAATTGVGRTITTIVFKAIGGGTSNISTLIASGDNGAVGDTFVAGSVASITVNAIPEPGTALLMGLGLAGLGLAGRRR